ncbi:hypothetical protein JCM10908_006429 [Rhodotorula pacifica]|uniref:uncharacterized protein n=1 Tax=Rhodotorula pacifica TaxID=1495444 RepID=UPI00316FC995
MPKAVACPPYQPSQSAKGYTNGLPRVIVAAVLESVDTMYQGPDRLQTLAIASLVSREWHCIARRRLYGRLLVCLWSPPTHAKHSFDLLSTLLMNRKLARMVHELVLHLEHASAVAATTTFTLFRDLVNLTRLSMTLTFSKATMVASHLDMLKNLRDLSVAGGFTKTFSGALYRLHRLKKLQLSSYPPDPTYQPTFELKHFIADIELAPQTFYKLTAFSCETLTTLVLSVSDFLPPIDISYLVNLRSLSFIAPADPLHPADIGMDCDVEEEERGGGQWVFDVLKTARNLRRLTFLSLRHADGAIDDVWEDLPYMATDILQTLPRSIEVLDLGAVIHAFTLDDLEDLIVKKYVQTPKLHMLYIGCILPYLVTLWGYSHLSLYIFASGFGVRVIFDHACLPVLSAAVCTF